VTDSLYIKSVCFKSVLCFRERQRQKFDNLQNKKGEYADIVENLQQVTLDNRQLEEERRQLESELNELQYIKPSAPAMSNGYSDSDSNNSSSSPTTFGNRVGRHIPVEPAQAVAYRKTEQAWFAKVSQLTSCCFQHVLQLPQSTSLSARRAEIWGNLLTWASKQILLSHYFRLIAARLSHI